MLIEGASQVYERIWLILWFINKWDKIYNVIVCQIKLQLSNQILCIMKFIFYILNKMKVNK